MAEETATLAAYVADLKFEDIPEEVLARAKVLTLDFLGSAIRARRDAESTPSLLKMLEALALDGKGQSTVFGDAKTWTPAVAALLNGALGHSLDFDDTRAAFIPPPRREPMVRRQPRQSCSGFRKIGSSRHSACPAARPRDRCSSWSTAPGTSAIRSAPPQ